MDRSALTRLVFGGLIVATLLVIAWRFFSIPGKLQTEEPTTTLSTISTSPTPLPLAPGKQSYSISQQGNGTKIISADFDPLDAKPGQFQTITLKIKGTVGVDSASVTFIGDDKRVSVPLDLTSGTKNDGIWSKTWTVNLAHESIYGATLTADNGQKPVNVDLWFR